MELKTIITCFAGRKEYMELQIKYVVKLLEKYDFIERYDIWDFAWSKEDSEFLKTLELIHPKIKIKYAPYYGEAKRAGDVASKQFAYFFHDAYDAELYKDYIFLKIDDDVVYIDIENFETFIRIRKHTPSHFLISANVINNNLNIPDPTVIHESFINNFTPQILSNTLNVIEYPSNLRLSINFCTWLGTELPIIQDEFSNGIGSEDEWRLCHIIPSKLGKNNLIVKDYKISHFSFGTQNFNKSEILNKYKSICNTII
jgi:hypothetical protein